MRTADHALQRTWRERSRLQSTPPAGPIRWHRAVWRPAVSLTSRVDVAAFRRDMGSERFVDLYPESDPRQPALWRFKILHRLKEDWMVETEGTLDVSSGAFGASSQIFYSKINDSWWYKLTNGGQVEFLFDGGTNTPP